MVQVQSMRPHKFADRKTPNNKQTPQQVLGVQVLCFGLAFRVQGLGLRLGFRDQGLGLSSLSPGVYGSGVLGSKCCQFLSTGSRPMSELRGLVYPQHT